jgi:hypothetical protein
VLLGVTAVILALFARFFIRLARRSRPAADNVDRPPGRPHRDGPAGRPDDRRAA